MGVLGFAGGVLIAGLVVTYQGGIFGDFLRVIFIAIIGMKHSLSAFTLFGVTDAIYSRSARS
jgi:hypothetical protein